MQINKVLEQGAKIKLGGIDFENVNMEMLIVTDENLEEHLVKQPAAIAYFGSLLKEAEILYDDAKKKNELRWKEMYSECANELSIEKKKATINDIEALVYGKYKKELEELNTNLIERRREKDNMEVFYDAWKQKGFILSSYVQIALTNLMSKDKVQDDSSVEDDMSKLNEFRKKLKKD